METTGSAVVLVGVILPAIFAAVAAVAAVVAYYMHDEGGN